MNKYISFFKMRFINGLQYRAAAYAGVVTQFAWGFMTLLMFYAFYENGQNSFPMEFSMLSSYIWLQQALLALFAAWSFENDIFDSIISGNIAYELCRPINIYNMWFLKSMATRVSRVVLRCLPILLVATFLPEPFNIRLPVDTLVFIMFLVSLVLGFLVIISFNMIIYISAFYTISPMGIRILSTSIIELLAGGIIPLPFFPDVIRKIVELLPFASMQNTPFLIYCGQIDISQGIYRILLQIFWIVALVSIGKLLISKSLKKVVIQGG